MHTRFEKGDLVVFRPLEDVLPIVKNRLGGLSDYLLANYKSSFQAVDGVVFIVATGRATTDREKELLNTDYVYYLDAKDPREATGWDENAYVSADEITKYISDSRKE